MLTMLAVCQGKKVKYILETEYCKLTDTEVVSPLDDSVIFRQLDVQEVFL